MASKIDLYADVTDRIVEALEDGVAPWVRPWESLGAFRNAVTGREYRGVNPFLLSIASVRNDFKDLRWATFRQWKTVNGSVRKGERSTLVVFWGTFKSKTKTDPLTGKPSVIPFLKYFRVFNAEQVDGADADRLAPLPEPVNTDARDATLDAFVSATGADIRTGGAAFYAPGTDTVTLPPFDSFKDGGAYYGVALHELTHWTGHPSRLNRKLANRFGSEAYAAEELIAELGSAFLCQRFRVDGTLQHPEYVANWLRVLKNDKRAIFTASSAARKAAEFLYGKTNTEAQAVNVGEAEAA